MTKPVCRYCAGVGKLTTRIHLVTVDGKELAPKEITVRRCEVCDGTGIQP